MSLKLLMNVKVSASQTFDLSTNTPESLLNEFMNPNLIIFYLLITSFKLVI